MIVFPNTKINLGLNIMSKRPDGFHDIESCFYPVHWQDALEIVPADDFAFQFYGTDIPGDPNNNLCVKAFELLKSDYDIPEVSIHLLKNIPIGAGLGGGSADCAFTFKLLNDLFQLEISDTRLEAYASKLGSDCPFFIRNQPVIATGTGTDLTPIVFSLEGYYIIIVHPGIHISTAEAYAGVQPAPADIPVAQLMDTDRIDEWKNHLTNDFEKSIFPKYPMLQDIKEKFYDLGAVYSSMTGSGSAIYGIFKEKTDHPFSAFKCYEGYLK